MSAFCAVWLIVVAATPVLESVVRLHAGRPGTSETRETSVAASDVRAALHAIGNQLAVVAGQAEYLLHAESADGRERREALEAILGAALAARATLLDVRRDVATAPAPGVAAPVPGASPPAPGAAPARARRVLLIDDEPDVLTTLGVLLRQAGHDVEAVTDGAAGVAAYRNRPFDCVLTDVTMRGMNGLMVARAIKDYDPRAWVVVLTGVPHDPRELSAAGVDRMIRKPCRRADMLAALEPVRS